MAVSVNVQAAGRPDPTAVPCALIVTALPAIVPVALPLTVMAPRHSIVKSPASDVVVSVVSFHVKLLQPAPVGNAADEDDQVATVVLVVVVVVDEELDVGEVGDDNAELMFCMLQADTATVSKVATARRPMIRISFAPFQKRVCCRDRWPSRRGRTGQHVLSVHEPFRNSPGRDYFAVFFRSSSTFLVRAPSPSGRPFQ